MGDWVEYDILDTQIEIAKWVFAESRLAPTYDDLSQTFLSDRVREAMLESCSTAKLASICSSVDVCIGMLEIAGQLMDVRAVDVIADKLKALVRGA